MTTLDQARNSVYNRLLSSLPGVPIALANELDVEPQTGPWVLLSVQGTGRDQISLGRKGNRRFDSTADAVSEIRVDQGDGLAAADALAVQIQTLFEGESFDGLAFDQASIEEGGPDGVWFVVAVVAAFRYEEIV